MKITITLLSLLITFVCFSQGKPMNSNNVVGASRGYDIDNYQEMFVNDSLWAVKQYNHSLKNAEHLKLTEKPTKMKRRTIFNAHKWDKNAEIEKQQKEYQDKVDKITEKHNYKIRNIREYRDWWVTYEKVERKRIAEKEKAEKIEAEKEHLRAIAEKKRREMEAEQEAEEERQRIAELKAMPTNPKYLQWKSKYEKSLSRSQTYMDRCEAIIKKNNYRNAFGQKMYDPSDFSQTDKKAFIRNIEAMGEQHEKIGELEDNRDYLGYWNNKASTKKATQSYRLSTYYNNKRYTFY